MTSAGRRHPVSGAAPAGRGGAGGKHFSRQGRPLDVGPKKRLGPTRRRARATMRPAIEALRIMSSADGDGRRADLQRRTATTAKWKEDDRIDHRNPTVVDVLMLSSSTWRRPPPVRRLAPAPPALGSRHPRGSAQEAPHHRRRWTNGRRTTASDQASASCAPATTPPRGRRRRRRAASKCYYPGTGALEVNVDGTYAVVFDGEKNELGVCRVALGGNLYDADVLEDHIRELADGPATPAPAAPVMVRSRAGRQRERRGRRVRAQEHEEAHVRAGARRVVGPRVRVGAIAAIEAAAGGGSGGAGGAATAL